MRPGWLALLLSISGLGAVFLKLGTPVVRAYPSPDGTMVIKLTLSRTPGFVAYLRSGAGNRRLGSGGDVTA